MSKPPSCKPGLCVLLLRESKRICTAARTAEAFLSPARTAGYKAGVTSAWP